MVNVLPGTAQSAGPTTWSRLNARVYARLTGGNIYGETGTVEIRVLPSQLARSRPTRASNLIRLANFDPLGSSGQASGSENDTAEVPLQAVHAYPNAPMQGTGWTVEIPSSGDLTVTASTDAPLSSVTVQLTTKSCDQSWDPAHTLSNPPVCARALNFSQRVPTNGVPFTVILTTQNNSSTALDPPASLNVLLTTNKVEGSRIPAGGSGTWSYNLTAIWNDFTEPSAVQDFVVGTGSDLISNAAQLLSDLEKAGSAASYGADAVSQVASIAPDLIKILSTHFVPVVSYQITIAGEAVASVNVYAKPQKMPTFQVYFLKWFAQTGWSVFGGALGGVAGGVVVPGPEGAFVGGVAGDQIANILAEWQTNDKVCSAYGQDSNQCAMVKAHWDADDNWYGQVLDGRNTTCASPPEAQCGPTSGCPGACSSSGITIANPLQVPPSSDQAIAPLTRLGGAVAPGTLLTVRALDSISAGARADDEFNGLLDEPVMSGRSVVLPKGTPVRLRVFQSAGPAGTSLLQVAGRVRDRQRCDVQYRFRIRRATVASWGSQFPCHFARRAPPSAGGYANQFLASIPPLVAHADRLERSKAGAIC